MTPIQLMMMLKTRIETIVHNYSMQESDGDHAMRAPKVWTQYLPEKLYDDVVDPADYPFVLVMLGGGDIPQEGTGQCYIAIMVAGYDEGLPVDGTYDRQGWLIPAEMIWRIVNSLEKDPVIGSFALQHPLTWELPEQDKPSPHWFGIINTTWSLRVPERVIDLENWDFELQSPSESELIEEIKT